MHNNREIIVFSNIDWNKPGEEFTDVFWIKPKKLFLNSVVMKRLFSNDEKTWQELSFSEAIRAMIDTP